MLLYIIRHGETRLNKEGKLQGRVDEPLNESGRELAVVTGEALKDVPFDLVITSPLSRAKETGILAVRASALKQGKEIPVIDDDRLMEFSWGSWDGEGCTPENYSIPTGLDNYNLFFTDPFRFQNAPDGESFQDLIERLGDFYHDLIHNAEYQDKTILISTHGCATRALLNPLYDDPTDFWQGDVPMNCAVNIVEVRNGVSRFLKKDIIFYDESLCNNRYTAIKE